MMKLINEIQSKVSNLFRGSDKVEHYPNPTIDKLKDNMLTEEQLADYHIEFISPVDAEKGRHKLAHTQEELDNYNVELDQSTVDEPYGELMDELSRTQLRIAELYYAHGVISIDEDTVHLTRDAFHEVFGDNFDTEPSTTHDNVELLSALHRDVEFVAIRYI